MGNNLANLACGERRRGREGGQSAKKCSLYRAPRICFRHSNSPRCHEQPTFELEGPKDGWIDDAEIREGNSRSDLFTVQNVRNAGRSNLRSPSMFMEAVNALSSLLLFLLGLGGRKLMPESALPPPPRAAVPSLSSPSDEDDLPVAITFLRLCGLLGTLIPTEWLE